MSLEGAEEFLHDEWFKLLSEYHAKMLEKLLKDKYPMLAAMTQKKKHLITHVYGCAEMKNGKWTMMYCTTDENWYNVNAIKRDWVDIIPKELFPDRWYFKCTREFYNSLVHESLKCPEYI